MAKKNKPPVYTYVVVGCKRCGFTEADSEIPVTHCPFCGDDAEYTGSTKLMVRKLSVYVDRGQIIVE